MVTLSVLIAHWEMSQWLFNVILLWFPSNAKFNQWRLHLLRELCLCSTPFSQCKFPQSSNSDQAQNDTCASCPAHVRMLKFTSKINRTLWGVSVVRTLAEHFPHTSLQNRLEHIVSFPSLLPSLLPSFSPSFFTLNLPLSFFLSSYHSSSPLHNTSVTWNAESNDPEVTGYQCLHSLLNWLITLILETTAIQTSV